MPPRHTYWTIILEGKPTAFRAHTEDELLPTLKQLQAKHPDAVMRWFARGKLWHSPDEERLARMARTAKRENRGRDWRPGGTHRDPRERFQIPRDERRRRFRERLFRDRQEGVNPPEKVPGDEQEPTRKPTSDPRAPARQNRGPWRPQGNRPPRGGDRPAGGGSDRPWKPKPPPGAGGGGWKPKGPPRDRGEWKPKGPPRDRGEWKPKGPPSDRGEWKPKGPPRDRGEWKPKGPPRDRGEWKPKGPASDRGEWKPKGPPRDARGWRPKGPKGPRGGGRGGGNRGGGNRGGGGRGGPR
jgi:hypothetical protein